MAISGDSKENAIGLHLSTGESFASMADRHEHPDVLIHLDTRGQEANKEFAKWLRTQTDDADTREKFVHEPNRRMAAEREAAASGNTSTAPAGRSTSGGKSST